MIFNEHEAWLPYEGEKIILTSPPIFEFKKKSKKEDSPDEDEGFEKREEIEDTDDTEDD